MDARITHDTEVSARSKEPHVGRAHPLLSVSDLDAAIEHYRTVLGFFLEWARYEGPSGGIANLWRGELSLFLRADSGSGSSCVYSHLADRSVVDALYQDLLQAGARVTQAPSERPWGTYELRVEDLDGNEFQFASFPE